MIKISPALFVEPFLYFATGLVCAAVAMALAYLNYMGHHSIRADAGALANNMIAQQETWPGNYTPGRRRLISWSFGLALITGLASTVMFGLGSFRVAKVFESFP